MVDDPTKTALTPQDPEDYEPTPEEAALLKDIHDKVNANREQRRYRENIWGLCLAFLNGYHWTRYSRVAGRLYQEKEPRKRKRLSQNLTRVFARKAVTRMMNQIPAWQPAAHSSSQKDRDRAVLATDVLRAKWIELGMERKLYKSALWGKTIGTGIAQTFWAENAGPIGPVPVTDENGQPVLDENEQPQMVEKPLGEVGVEVVPGPEFFLDPYAMEVPDAAWCARRRGRPLAWIRQNFPKMGQFVKTDTGPDAISPVQQVFSQAGVRLGDDAEIPVAADDKREPMATIMEYYEGISPQHPKGLTIVCAQNVVLFQGELMFGEYPFRYFRDQDTLVGFWGQSTVEMGLETQIELNITVSQLAEVKNLASKVFLLLAKNSKIDKGFMERGIGEEVMWSGIPGTQPAVMNLGGTSAMKELLEHYATCKQAMQELYGFHDISMGISSKDAESGVAIQLLSEQDAEQQGDTMNAFLNFVKDIGRDILRWAQWGYKEERLASYTNEDNRSIVRHFVGADLAGATDIELNMSTQLSESKAARFQQFLNLVKSGAMPMTDPHNARLMRRMFDLGQMEEFYEEQELQEQFTDAEIDRLDAGEDCQPLEYEDHDVAMRIHARRMLRPDFVFPPENGDEMAMVEWQARKERHTQHYAAHIMVKGNLMQLAMGAGIGPLGEPPGAMPGPKDRPPPNFNPEVPPREIPAPKVERTGGPPAEQA